MNKNKIVSIVPIGDKGANKTLLLHAFIGNYLLNRTDHDHVQTVFDNYNHCIKVDGQNVNVGLSDTSGIEEYYKMRTCGTYFQKDAFIICYSTVDPETFENVEKWADEISYFSPGTPYILVGTDIDLRDGFPESLSGTDIKPITYAQGLNKKKEIKAAAFFECSLEKSHSYLGTEVKDILQCVTKVALRNSKPKKSKYFEPIVTSKQATLNCIVFGDDDSNIERLFCRYRPFYRSVKNTGLLLNEPNIVTNTIDDRNVKLYIMDSSQYQVGQSLNAIVLCYSIIAPSSMKCLIGRANLIKKKYKNLPIILVGNEKHLRVPGRIATTYEDGMNAMKEMGAVAFYECSSIENDEIDSIMEEVTKVALKQYDSKRNKNNGNCVIC